MTDSPPSRRRSAPLERQIEHEREGLLRQVSALLVWPMTVLAFIWLTIMVIEFTNGTGPILETLNYAIWAVFILHFLLELWIAPRKLRYIQRNWLTLIALFLPAVRIFSVFRLFRVLRFAQVGRSVRLVRWLASLNRGMRATQNTVRKRGLTYVLIVSGLVIFAGAAGIYVFENPQSLREQGLLRADQPGISTYGEGVWWTAMMLTTMGTDYFPKTTEGRILAWLLAVYAFAIFGYITATVASLIIQVDQSGRGGVNREVAALRSEIAHLQSTLADLTQRMPLREQ